MLCFYVKITIYYGRHRDRLKALFWEGDGFMLLYKRLENGSFQWPKDADEVRNITQQQYRWLVEGLSIDQKKVIQNISHRKIL